MLYCQKVQVKKRHKLRHIEDCIGVAKDSAGAKCRCESEAVEVRCEMDVEDHLIEMAAPGSGDIRNELNTIARLQMSSLKGKDGLRGEACSRELEAPRTRKDHAFSLS